MMQKDAVFYDDHMRLQWSVFSTCNKSFKPILHCAALVLISAWSSMSDLQTLKRPLLLQLLLPFGHSLMCTSVLSLQSSSPIKGPGGISNDLSTSKAITDGEPQPPMPDACSNNC
jgi:hypothetical protein